ncbi:unnamed protein product [Paramecium sonneborni]|uniref:Uncharacterized protein n=1 Tax=Paramecium sonneborni TaxID=65129 RepID=A0A8S1MU50_9CILI|nr:unnamed protein product [Paramecium sonneborni]
MSQKQQSSSNRVSYQENLKKIRLQSSMNYRSHNNLMKHNRFESETFIFQNNQLKGSRNSLDYEIQFQNNKNQLFERQLILNGTTDNNKTFITILKEQIKKLELDLLDKVKEIDQYKKMSLVTQYQELYVELQNYQKLVLLQNYEILDLKEQIRDQQQLSIEDLYQLQEKKIQNLLLQNHEFKTENAKFKTEKNYYFSQLESTQIELSIKEKEILKLTNQVKQLEQKLKNNLYMPMTRQQIFKESVENAHLQEQLKEQQKKFEDNLIIKQQEIDNLKQLIKNIEKEKCKMEQKQISLSEKTNSLIEIQKIEQKLNINQQEQSQSLVDQSSQQSQKQNTKKIDLTKKQIQEIDINMIDSNIIDKEQYAQTSSRKEKKIIRVNFYEVQQFGMEIRFKLLGREVSIQKVEDLFNKYEKSVKIHELLDMLLQEPFKIQSYEQRKLIARYLVEDNYEDYIVYDALRSNDTSIVLSIFKQLIGKYELFQKEEIFKIENELKQIFEKIQYSFNYAIQQLTIKKKYLKQGQCERVDYEQAIKYTEISLTPRQLEYIYFLNYTFYQDLSIIYYQNVMTYFNKSK